MDPHSASLVAGLNPALMSVFDDCYRILVAEEVCDPYVKTIYVGFSIAGEMVAAAYPRSRCIEIALALAEDVEGPAFKDASHLTWPTMPVSIEVTADSDPGWVESCLRDAASRVRTGTHSVRRPNDYFVGRTPRARNREGGGVQTGPPE